MPLDFTKYTIINNLYHDSMSTTLPQTCLVQTKIDSRTFEETPTLFNDNYAVLENINKAFNQTIFQQNNEFVLLRLEELYTPTSTNLRGVQVDGATTTNLSRRYDVQIGVNQTLKPISPDMLRFIKRQVKSNTIQFDYTPFDEVIKNSSFSRGALVSSYPTFKDYSIENFSLVSNFLTDTPVTGVEVFRRETYVSNVGPLSDNYIIIPQASLGGNNYLLKSQSVRVSFGERIKIVIDSRFTKTFNVNPFLINTKVATLVVKLVGGTTTYYLNEKGDWQTYDSGNFYSNFVRIEYNDTEKIKPEEWQTLEVESLPFIESGNLSVYLAVPVTPDEPGQERYFKNLKIEIANQFDTNEIQISGVQSIFNKNTDLKFEFNDSMVYVWLSSNVRILRPVLKICLNSSKASNGSSLVSLSTASTTSKSPVTKIPSLACCKSLPNDPSFARCPPLYPDLPKSLKGS
jgi:hypothetical protein